MKTRAQIEAAIDKEEARMEAEDPRGELWDRAYERFVTLNWVLSEDSDYER